MFQADETACDLYRRINLPSFSLNYDRSRHSIESLPFGSLAEVLVQPGDISEAVLDSIFQFLTIVKNGAVVHISLGMIASIYFQNLHYICVSITCFCNFHRSFICLLLMLG